MLTAWLTTFGRGLHHDSCTCCGANNAYSTQLWLRGMLLHQKGNRRLLDLGTMAWSTMLARRAGGSIDINRLCESHDSAWWHSCRPVGRRGRAP